MDLSGGEVGRREGGGRGAACGERRRVAKRWVEEERAACSGHWDVTNEPEQWRERWRRRRKGVLENTLQLK